MPPEGLEPSSHRLKGGCSGQLSYGGLAMLMPRSRHQAPRPQARRLPGRAPPAGPGQWVTRRAPPTYPQGESNPRYQRERLACLPLHHGGGPRSLRPRPTLAPDLGSGPHDGGAATAPAAPARLVPASGAQSAPASCATTSISTSIRGSISAVTSTIVITGRASSKNSPCARPTSSAREMSVT